MLAFFVGSASRFEALSTGLTPTRICATRGLFRYEKAAPCTTVDEGRCSLHNATRWELIPGARGAPEARRKGLHHASCRPPLSSRGAAAIHEAWPQTREDECAVVGDAARGRSPRAHRRGNATPLVIGMHKWLHSLHKHCRPSENPIRSAYFRYMAPCGQFGSRCSAHLQRYSREHNSTSEKPPIGKKGAFVGVHVCACVCFPGDRLFGGSWSQTPAVVLASLAEVHNIPPRHLGGAGGRVSEAFQHGGGM